MLDSSSHFSSSFHDIINFEATINSGQMFLWEKYNNSWYGVYGEHILKFTTTNYNLQYGNVYSNIEEDDNTIDFFSFPEFKNWQRHIFRLNDNFKEILSSFSKDTVISKTITMYPGLRLMRQEPHQCIFSFVCSSNTSINMIRRMLKNLSRKFGKRIVVDGKPFYTFPTAKTINDATVGELALCGVGFRAKALKAVAENITSGDLDINLLLTENYETAKKQLMKINGIGNKIADCILLFSLEKLEAFPIDVWVARAIRSHYHWLISENKNQNMRKNSVIGEKLSAYQYKNFSEIIRNYFGKYAGYAQQYLFYDIRNSSAKKW